MISLIIFPVHSKGLESKSDQITESEFEIYDYVENPILTLFNLKLDVLSQETRYYTPCSQKHTHFEFSVRTVPYYKTAELIHMPTSSKWTENM